MRNVFNRLIKFFFLMMVIFLSFVSCVTTHTEPIVVNNITNHEDTAKVLIKSNIIITKFNGTEVSDGWRERGMELWHGPYNLELTIPAGETTFVYNMSWVTSSNSYGYTYLEGKDLEFSFNFEAGKEYTVGYYTKSEGKKFLGVGTVKNDLYLAVWKGFYPEPNTKLDKDHESNIIEQWFVRSYNN